MRITLVLPCYPWRPIGAFRVAYEYANQLAARGNEVTVVHARRLRDEAEFWAPKGLYRRLRGTAGRLRDAALVPSMSWCNLDKRVRTLFVPEPTARLVPDADAIIAGAWGTAPYVLRCPESKGEKFHLLQGHAVAYGLPKAWVDTIWTAPLHNIAVSGWLGEIGVQLGVKDITVIPNGINASLFRVIRPIEDRPRRMAMLYSPRDWKGPADGLKALRIAKQQYPDLEAVLFGVGQRTGEIPDWIEYQRDVPQERLVQEIYNSSSIFLCASWNEGFALPPLEAMACGCAVVTTDCGGNRDYVEPEKNALVSPPREPESLADNLLHALGDDALRLRLARAGVERVREFTWDRSTDKLESLIRQHVQAEGKHAPPIDDAHSDQEPSHAEA